MEHKYTVSSVNFPASKNLPKLKGLLHINSEITLFLAWKWTVAGTVMRISAENPNKYSSCWSYQNRFDIAPGNFILLGDKVQLATRYSLVLLSQGKGGGIDQAHFPHYLPLSLCLQWNSSHLRPIKSVCVQSPIILAVQWWSYAVEVNWDICPNPCVKECFSA